MWYQWPFSLCCYSFIMCQFVAVKNYRKFAWCSKTSMLGGITSPFPWPIFFVLPFLSSKSENISVHLSGHSTHIPAPPPCLLILSLRLRSKKKKILILVLALAFTFLRWLSPTGLNPCLCDLHGLKQNTVFEVAPKYPEVNLRM